MQEFVVQKLCIDTTRMSRAEKLAAVITLGWYWLITRKILKQARHLTYTITNKRLLQKEEVTGKTAILCNRKTKVFESEFTFAVRHLKYMRHEVLKPSMFSGGCTSIDFNFVRFPKETVPTQYVLPITLFFRALWRPVQSALREAKEDHSGKGPAARLKFLYDVVKDISGVLLEYALLLVDAVIASISAYISLVTVPLGVTPTLLTGKWDPRLMSIVIRDVDKCTLPLSDTPTAEITDHLALSSSIIAAVLSVTSHKQTIGIGQPLVQAPNVLHQPLAESKIKHLHGAPTKKQQPVVHNLCPELMPMYAGEVVLHASPYNYVLSLLDTIYNLLTCCIYDKVCLNSALAHKNSLVLTQSRIITVKALFTDQGQVEHLLTETFLIAHESVSTVEAELQRNTRHSATVELSVSVKGGGTVYLGTHADAHLKNPAHYGAFMSLLCTASAATADCLDLPSIDITASSKQDVAFLKKNFTLEALVPGERILQAFRSDEPHGACSEYTASSCMITDKRVIFVRCTSGRCGNKHVHQVYVPYHKINGVYWSNFYVGKQHSEDALSSAAATAKQSAAASHSHFGNQGMELRVSINQGEHWQVGVTAHALYFGDGCAQLDQVVQTLGRRVFAAQSGADAAACGTAAQVLDAGRAEFA